MARKAATVSSKALVPFGETVPVLTSAWQDRLAAHAKKQSAVAGAATGGWPFLSFKGGMIHRGDTELDNPTDVIVLDGVFENNYFEEEYDPGNPVPPICWAIGADEEKLAPPADLPTKQAVSCSVCKWNAFGSDDRGKGKACKNSRRVAVLPADALSDLKLLRETEGVRLRIPVMSLRFWSKFVQAITGGFQRPLWMLRTRLSVTLDPKAQFLVKFQPLEWINNEEQLEILEKRYEEVQTYLYQEPQRQVAGDNATRGGKPAPKRRRVGTLVEPVATPAGTPPAAKSRKKF
jgi:hypothetical protein